MKTAILAEIVNNMPCAYGDDVQVNEIKLSVAKVSNIDAAGNFHKKFELRSFTKAQADRLSCQDGDLLVVKSSGSKINVLSGKTAICTKKHAGKLVSSNFLLRLQPKKDIVDSKYLWYFLNSSYSKAFVLKVVGTTTYPNLKWPTYSEHPIPLPPLAEQKGITAILDKADAIRRKRQQAIKLANEYLYATFIDMFGDPVNNNKDWPRSRFEKFLDKIESGWSPKCLSREAYPNEWGVLKLGAITTCKYIENENKALPDDKEPRESIEVKKGDLLFTRKNTYDLVAACAYVFDTRHKLMISDTIFRLKLDEAAELRPEYLWALLTHPGKRKQVQSLAGGSAGSMPNISKGRLLKQEIEVPPLDLQIKFANIFHKIKEVSVKHEGMLRDSDNCFGSILQRAFHGEL